MYVIVSLDIGMTIMYGMKLRISSLNLSNKNFRSFGHFLVDWNNFYYFTKSVSGIAIYIEVSSYLDQMTIASIRIWG